MIFESIILFVLLFIINGLVYQFLYELYLWVLILSLIFYLSYLAVKIVYYQRKKNQAAAQAISIKKEIPRATDKDLQTLKDFMRKNLKQGFHEAVLKEALAKQGWPKEKVEQALRESK